MQAGIQLSCNVSNWPFFRSNPVSKYINIAHAMVEFVCSLNDGEFEKERVKDNAAGELKPDPFVALLMEQTRIEHAPMEVY